jgi:hypothetical protein
MEAKFGLLGRKGRQKFDIDKVEIFQKKHFFFTSKGKKQLWTS